MTANCTNNTFRVYATRMQPATQFIDPNMPKGLRRQRCKPDAMRRCLRCNQMRPAKDMYVQVYYDSIRYWCRDRECHCKPKMKIP